ncbi:hypothetical protein DFJ73DRAFT_59233 [Zopfochytrium polystomum]|nr:hypothetical protein DFJ73DRAFT_59233 [Zopfochytrium polystomum]
MQRGADLARSICWLRRLESDFFASLAPEAVQALRPLEPRDLLLEGEIAFLLAGVKPCVLVHFSTLPALATLYVDRVVRPFLVDHEFFDCTAATTSNTSTTRQRLTVNPVAQGLWSRETESFDGGWLIHFENDDNDNRVATGLGKAPSVELLLRGGAWSRPSEADARENGIEEDVGLNRLKRELKEDDLAALLGYPTTLPAEPTDDFVEFVYLDASMPDGSGQGQTAGESGDNYRVLMSYGGRQSQVPAAHRHFRECRAATEGVYDLRLLVR